MMQTADNIFLLYIWGVPMWLFIVASVIWGLSFQYYILRSDTPINGVLALVCGWITAFVLSKGGEFMILLYGDGSNWFVTLAVILACIFQLVVIFLVLRKVFLNRQVNRPRPIVNRRCPIGGGRNNGLGCDEIPVHPRRNE